MLRQRGTNGELHFKSMLDRNLNAKYVYSVKQDSLQTEPSIVC